MRKEVMLALLLVLSTACGCMTCTEEERLRVPSQNRLLDAVLVQENCGGALDGYDYYVYIVSKGKSKNYKRSELVLQAQELAGEELIWTNPQQLEIKYTRARIFHFKNFVDAEIKDNSAFTTIRVHETPK